MKNKILTLVLVLSLVLCLFGCSVEQLHKISYEENENCEISLSKEEAYRNEEIEVTVSNITEGYEIEKITVNDYLIDDGKFLMPNEDALVKVYLKEVSSEVVGDETYLVSILPNEYGVISSEKVRYKAGEVVNLDYACKGSYILSKFYVNDNPIEGTSFVMPEGDAIVKAEFINAIGDTDWQLQVYAGTNAANSYWYFKYGDDGLEVKVIVVDMLVCGQQFQANTGMQDNIEVVLSAKSSATSYEADKTVKVLVSAIGGDYIQVASSSTAWATKTFESDQYHATSVVKTLENKDGYQGYEVNFFISYSLLSLTKDTALGNITACIAMRNTNGYGSTSTKWGSNHSFKDLYSHPVINADGTLGERS